MLDMTSFAAALKQHYVPLKVANMVYKKNPLLALLEKDEKFGGQNLPLPLIYGNPQGRSQNFAKAQANKTSSKVAQFLLTRDHDYSLADIDNETIEASEGNADAFMKAATTEIDGAVHGAERSLAIGCYGDGSGVIGQISAGSNVGTATITLANIDDITNFEVGMTIALSAAVTGSVRSGTAVITKVDRSLGTLTFGGNLTSYIAAAAASDYISVDGDFGAKVKGLAAWIPFTRPTGGDSFFGLDRSADPTRLAGVYVDGRGGPIEEVLVDLSSQIGREGGTPDMCFMNNKKRAELVKALGSKVQYVDVKASATIGFKGIQIEGDKGPITVLSDQNCPSDRVYMLQMDTWKLYSLGMAPKILNSDGLQFLRLATGDGVEVRVGYYAQLGCQAPGWNGVAQLA